MESAETAKAIAELDAKLNAMGHAQFAEVKRVYPPEIEAMRAEAMRTIKDIYIRHFATLERRGRRVTGPEREAVARAAREESEPIRRALLDLDLGVPYVVTVPANHPWAATLAREVRPAAEQAARAGKHRPAGACNCDLDDEACHNAGHWQSPAESDQRPPLTADFTRGLPGGTLDDSTYSQIEDALDAIDAPATDSTGRYMTLVERIKALRLGAEVQP